MNSVTRLTSRTSTDRTSLDGPRLDKEENVTRYFRDLFDREERSYFAWFNDGWWAEVLCMVIGCSLLLALCLILAIYDGKQPPRFGSRLDAALSLNTVVAIISAAAKAIFLLPTAECVSQLKWQWMASGDRQLSDVSTFDKASRGINGGLGLLWTTRMRSIASIGALLVLYSISVEPFSQQLLSTTDGRASDPNGNATIEISSSITGIPPQDGMVTLGKTKNYGTSSLTLNMLGTVQFGLFNGNDSVAPTSPIACSSGNCTFDPYLTLGVCGSVANVTSHLKVRNVSTELPSGQTEAALQYYVTPDNYLTTRLAGNLVIANVSSATSLHYPQNSSQVGQGVLDNSNSVAFRHVNASIADAYIIVGQPGDTPDQPIYSAFEFMLQWCVQNYSTSVTNGKTNTSFQNIFFDFTQLPEPHAPVLGYPSGADDTGYSVDANTQNGLQAYFEQQFYGAVFEGADSYLYTTSDVIRAIFQPFNVWVEHPANEVFNLSNGIQGTNDTGLLFTVENVATSMTNYVRHWSRTNVAQGTIWHEQPHIVVRWKWIAAPLAFAVINVVFLLLTILSQRMAETRLLTWKTSSLAVLHALDPELQDTLKGSCRHSDMVHRDSKEMVRLVQTAEDGWRIVRTSGGTSPPHRIRAAPSVDMGR